MIMKGTDPPGGMLKFTLFLPNRFFAAWFMSKESVQDELAMTDSLAFRMWYFAIRYITPVAVVLVFLHVIGVV